VREAPASTPATASRCGGCHEHEVRAWSASPHARHAVPVATPPGGADAAVGSRWMQAYLRKDAAGVHRILPQCRDLRAPRWLEVHEVLAEIAGGASGLGPRSLPPVEQRSFDVDCSGCHASGARVRHDTLTASLVSTWRDLAIDCDACHGDPAPHRDGAPGTIARLGSLTPRGQVMLCGRCHGGPATDGDPEPREAETFVARAGDHESLFTDGAAGAQNYQVASFVRNPCFSRGGLTCTACHDPHGSAREGTAPLDALCVSCHPAFGGRDHTHHDSAGEGARCVSCHMPRLLTGLLRHQREHRIGVPVPGIAGARDACTSCHAELGAAAVEAAWRSWYGDRAVAAAEKARAAARAIALARAGDPAAAAALRSVLGHPDPFVRAAAIARLGEPALARSDPSPEVRVAALRGAPADAPAEVFVGFLKDVEPRVRAEAAVALASRGDDTGRAFRPDVERLARAAREDVASRWVLATWCLDDGRPGEAVAWLEEALAFEPGSPDVWFLLAQAHLLRRRTAAFEEAVREGVRHVAAAVGRGEAADRDLERFVGIQIARGRRALARAILDEAATRLPGDVQRKRFTEMAERLDATR